MKNFIVFLLFFTELIFLAIFIGFIWYLSDSGMPLTHVTYVQKILSVLVIIMGLAGPVSAGILVGNKISKIVD